MLTDSEILRELENIHHGLGPIINISEKYPGESIVAHINVNATELVNQIFSRSSKAYVLIKDDLIIYGNKAFMDLVGIEDYEDIFKHNFYKFLAKGNKTHLLSNLKEMLVNDIEINLSAERPSGEIITRTCRAIYIEDSTSLTYILFEG